MEKMVEGFLKGNTPMKYTRLYTLLLMLLLGLWLFAKSHTFVVAQETREEIVVAQRQADMTILSNGDMQVVEQWQVDFRGGPFTSMSYEIADNGFEGVDNWSVSEQDTTYQSSTDGTPASFYGDSTAHASSVTWFFAPTTDTTRNFTVQYTVRQAVRIYDDYDQLRWNVIERDRTYLINAAQVTIHLPSLFDPSQLHTNLSRYWIKNESVHRVIDGQTVEFTGETFRPGDAWEIQVDFPHGFVASSPPAWQVHEDEQRRKHDAEKARLAAQRQANNQATMMVALVVLIGGVFVNVWVWIRFVQRIPIPQETTDTGDLPDTIPAGMASILVQGRATTLATTAAIIDMAQRGFIRIIEQRNADTDTRDFLFVRMPKADESHYAHERHLLGIIFGKKPQRLFSTIQAILFQQFGSLKKELYDDMVQVGYVTENPEELRNRYRTIGLVAKFLSLLGAFFIVAPGISHNAPLIFLIPLAVLPFGIGIFLLSLAMHRYTTKGAEAIAAWKSWQQHLQHPETSQAHSNSDTLSSQFATYLPYVVASGDYEAWINRFADSHNQTHFPDWYQSENAPDQHIATLQEGFIEMVQRMSSAFDRLAV